MKKIALVLLALPVLVLGLNYRQLGSAGTIWLESLRLTWQARHLPQEFQTPEPMEDRFETGLSPQFWEFTTINGAGQVSNDPAWHAAAMTFDRGLSIQHFPDLDFQNENADFFQTPAAGQYNNVTLIGGSGFQPTPSSDVVLQFSARVSEFFYGTAGVIFQPVGTLRKDGVFVKPFDMFGFAVIGEQSSFNGINGSLCYLALNWAPVRVEAIASEARDWHAYEIRLRWLNQTEWLGIVKVDGVEMCSLPMPAFGAVEAQVWSDNALVTQKPRRWWEIAPATELNFQDGGEKQFDLKFIRIFSERR
jgi:hypothetical protein